jgi:threonine dehydratase
MTTAPPSPCTVPLASIRQARDQLAGVTCLTPVQQSMELTERYGGAVYLKCENLQRTGSFKLRGAYTRLVRLSPAERARGVVAASAGNHAQGVALAARLLGIDATVYMPTLAAPPKLAATAAFGAQVCQVGETVDDALTRAQDHAVRTGAVLVHPFDHADLIAGQGTIGLELLDQCPDLNTIICPVGGGGLIAGIAAAVKSIRPEVTIIGVQAAGAAAFRDSLTAGRVQTAPTRTIADGIAVGRPGDLTYSLVADLCEAIVTVSDDEIARAVIFGLERAKLTTEPAGATALAAALGDNLDLRPPVAVILSGGNIDPQLLAHILRHGLNTADRHHTLRLRLPDRPGSLADLLELLADAHANVLDVELIRTDPTLPFGVAEVAVHLETRGPEHLTQVLAVTAGLGG